MKSNVITFIVFAILIGLFALSSNDWKLPWASEPPRPAGVAWCEAHNAELDKCTVCNPKLAREGTFAVMRREPKAGECKNTLVQITLAKGMEQKVDLKVQAAEARELEEWLEGNADLDYIPSRFSRVAPRVSGIIRQVKAILGQEVEEGTVLAVLESADFGAAKSDYLQAKTVWGLRKQTYDQRKAIAAQLAARDVLEAETAFREAELALQRAELKLAGLGLSKDQIQGLKDNSPMLDVVAPFKGVLVEAVAVPGEIGSPEKPIFSVADLSRLFTCIDLPETQLPKVAKDQRILFTVKGIEGEYRGKVVAIGSEVNERTRNGRVIAEIKNREGLLKAKMFGRARIILKEKEGKILVPKDAVQYDNTCCNVVFVNTAANIYQVRAVKVGLPYGSDVEIKEGLAEGDKVVTVGSFLLKAEMLRGEMGAG